MKHKPWTSKDYLENAYTKRRMTIDQIAEECVSMGYKVTAMTIFNWLSKFDLVKNSRTLGKRKIGGGSKKGFYE